MVKSGSGGCCSAVAWLLLAFGAHQIADDESGNVGRFSERRVERMGRAAGGKDFRPSGQKYKTYKPSLLEPHYRCDMDDIWAARCSVSADQTVVTPVEKRSVRLAPQNSVALLRRCRFVKQLWIVLHEIRQSRRFTVSHRIALVSGHRDGSGVGEPGGNKRFQAGAQRVHQVEQVANACVALRARPLVTVTPSSGKRFKIEEMFGAGAGQVAGRRRRAPMMLENDRPAERRRRSGGKPEIIGPFNFLFDGQEVGVFGDA